MRATRITLALVVLVGLTFGGVGVAAADGDHHEKRKDGHEARENDRGDREKRVHGAKKARERKHHRKKEVRKRDRKRARDDRERKKARKKDRKRTKRVRICHVSKKGSETLEVSKRTAKKHLKHHRYDHLGPCVKKSAEKGFERKDHH